MAEPRDEPQDIHPSPVGAVAEPQDEPQDIHPSPVGAEPQPAEAADDMQAEPVVVALADDSSSALLNQNHPILLHLEPLKAAEVAVLENECRS